MMLSRSSSVAALLAGLLAIACPSSALGQNVSASQVRLVPALPPFTCPAGRVCLVGDASKSPYRAAFVDASGGVAGAGDSWRLRLYPGAPPGALNGDIWYDTVAHAAYVQQNGVPTGIGPLAFGPQLAGRIFAGPCSGAAASATFRALCSADLTTALAAPPPFGQTTPGLVKGTLIEAVTNFVGSCSGCTNIPGSQIVGPVPIGTLPAHASTHQPGGSDPVITGAPVTIGSANSAGSATDLARADHVHDHGSQPGGSAHAVAVSGSSAGFLSGADKAKLDTVPTPTAANKLLYDTGSAYAETAACSSASTVLVGGSPPACAAVPDAALSANIVTLTGAQILTNKTLTSPTIASPTLSGTVLGTYTLGGTPTFPVIPIVSGGTNSNTALANSRAVVSSGGKIVETASACGAGTVLGGGSPPDCTAAAALSTSLTTPSITSTSQLSLNAATANNVTVGVNGVVTATFSASGVTFAQPLGMSSQKISGLTSGTSSGEALAYPWLTATNGSASLSSSPYNVASGTYASIGLSAPLPSAGTYQLAVDLRTLINASVGTGGFIECQLYNTTDATAIANSERIGAYEPVVAQQYYGQISINELVTVASAKTIDVQCLRTGATTYTTSAVYSDANGRSRFSYVKVGP